MKKLLTLLILSISTVCSAETLTINGTPGSLPQNLPLGSYSPMLEISYEGLTAQQYTLKEYTIIVHADDGLKYDSQEVRIDVSPMEVPAISLTSYPECGGITNIEGFVSGTNNYEEYVVITYIFIGGYGWITKPYFETPKTPIQEDGTFEVDFTTGGIDDLAEIIYVGVARHGADIPIFLNLICRLSKNRPSTVFIGNLN